MLNSTASVEADVDRRPREDQYSFDTSSRRREGGAASHGKVRCRLCHFAATQLTT